MTASLRQGNEGKQLAQSCYAVVHKFLCCPRWELNPQRHALEASVLPHAPPRPDRIHRTMHTTGSTGTKIVLCNNHSVDRIHRTMHTTGSTGTKIVFCNNHSVDRIHRLSLIHISEPTRRTP